mgnify:CR=1 FL=1
MVLYLIAIIILIYYFSLEFNELLRLSPTGRIVLLLLSCLIMYFGGWFYTADTFYLKISLFYFTDIPTYKKNRDYLFPSLTGGRFYTADK